MQETIQTEHQPNTAIDSGKYIIETVTGKNDTGITYKALNTEENEDVYILQYAPQNTAEAELETKQQQFVENAKMLANFDHKNIVKVLALFAEENSIYMVVPFIEGQMQKEFLKSSNHLPKYVPQIEAVKEYIKTQNIAEELLPKKPHFLYFPENEGEYNVMLVHFGAVQIFNNIVTQTEKTPVEEKQIEEKTETPAFQTPKTETRQISQQNTVIKNQPAKEELSKTKEIQRMQRQKYANAPLACSSCKRPIPICRCKKY
jgi:serine/threonine protein kinase